MSKRKLLVTILIFIVTIALVVGASYLVSLLLKNQNTKTTVNGISNQTCIVMEIKNASNQLQE